MINRMNLQTGGCAPRFAERMAETRKTNPLLLFLATMVAAMAIPEILPRHLGF
jgi:hypothetical protein